MHTVRIPQHIPNTHTHTNPACSNALAGGMVIADVLKAAAIGREIGSENQRLWTC